MTHSNLKIEVQDPYIHVAMRGTCLRAKYRKQDAPWLAPEEYGTPAKLRLAMAAMGKPETNVASLCAELGVTRATLYRHVSPTGEARSGAARLLSRRA